MYTYSYMVHVWCIFGALYGSCMVHKEQNPSFGNNFSAMYGACMVHVRCIHDQDYSKEEQQTRPRSEIERLWSRPIGKQHW